MKYLLATFSSATCNIYSPWKLFPRAVIKKISDIEYLLNKVQQVIVMTVTPGFGGQRFLQEQVDKIKHLYEIRKNSNYNYDIAVDGGVNIENAKICKNNGADVLAVGSYLLSKNYNDYKQWDKIKVQSLEYRL